MEKHYEEKDQTPTLIDGGQVDEAIVNQAPVEKGVFNTGITSTQIEQVIDLPIPTTDDSGKVLKVDAEGKWELAADSEGTVVVANPTLAGTESSLTSLQVGSTKYKVPEGMEVLGLSNISGTLTDAQYELASGNNCVIKFNGRLYYKSYQDSYGISYIYPSIITAGNTNIQKERIEIDAETKAYTLYTDDEIIVNPTLDGTESSLTGLQVGDAKYKVGGSEVVAYEGTSIMPEGVVFENWTLHRAIKDGNILWFVLTGTIANNTSSSVSFNQYVDITLPSSISSKIYRIDGTSCDQVGGAYSLILYHQGTTGSAAQRFYLQSSVANVIRIMSNGSLSIEPNSTNYLNVRIPIFLDIGTVQ